MNKSFAFDASFIDGIQIDESFGKYGVLCKAGNACNFDLNQMSNQPHFHNSYELCIVTAGSGYFICDGKTYRISRGDIFVARPQEIHEVRVSGFQSLQVVFFFIEIHSRNDTLSYAPEDRIIHSFLNGHRTIQHEQNHLLSYLEFIHNYCSARRTRGFAIQQAIKNMIIESMDELSENRGACVDAIPFSNSTLELALDYIDRNLHVRILVSDIAAHSCSSERNLHHLFKKHLNRTIVDYINEKKMNLAAHYLARQFSVRDTAIQVGVGDSTQLTRLFKKYKTVTPKKYQLSNISNTKDFGRRQQD